MLSVSTTRPYKWILTISFHSMDWVLAITIWGITKPLSTTSTRQSMWTTISPTPTMVWAICTIWEKSTHSLFRTLRGQSAWVLPILWCTQIWPVHMPCWVEQRKLYPPFRKRGPSTIRTRQSFPPRTSTICPTRWASSREWSSMLRRTVKVSSLRICCLIADLIKKFHYHKHHDLKFLYFKKSLYYKEFLKSFPSTFDFFFIFYQSVSIAPVNRFPVELINISTDREVGEKL